MNQSYHRYFFIIFILIVFIFLFQISIRAEIYPTQVMFKINSDGEIIVRDDFFEIVEMENYILIPLVSISRWLDLELSYDRENELLTVFHKNNDKIIQIDLKNEIYYGFPEWSTDSPLVIEGDFYVATYLIEYITNAKLKWLPRKQEIILDYDYIEEKDLDEIVDKIIKFRPESFEKTPDITGPEFSIGSIYYKIGFDYIFAEDNDDYLSIYNLINIYGRAGDWNLSADQKLEYDIKTEEILLEYPYLNAKNVEKNRMIIIGDNRFSFPNTLGRVNLRGLYFQYPIQQISEKRAYTSVSGEAKEGSTVFLYVNDILIGEKYIYRTENKYYFDNVPLKTNRTNIIRLVTRDIDNTEKEVVKKVAGSLYIFEEGTNEGIFAIGKYNKLNASDSLIELGGFEVKYAPSSETSFFWEIGSEKGSSTDYKGFNSGSMMRLAVRPENRPLVFSADWLASNEGDMVQHGGRINTLYTRKDGHIKNTISYILPVIEENVDVEAGQHIQITYEKEFNENWLMDIDLKNSRSILNMDELNLNTYNLSFNYSDKARNNFKLAAELANRKEFIEWDYLDLIEEKRNWFEILLEGRTYRGSTRLGSKLIYELSDIYFEDSLGIKEDSKRGDYANVDLNISKILTDNLILIGNLISEYNWFEGSKLDSDLNVNVSARLKTGKYTSITAGLSRDTKFDRDSDGDGYIEESEAELILKHRVPRNIYFTAGIKNIFMEEDSAFSGKTTLDYTSLDNDWELSLNYEYIAPYGNRENPQQKASIELSKHLLSGLVGSLSFERSYASSASKEPLYEAMVTFSQAFGFADGNVKAKKFLSGEHNSFIAGVVYLDENGNKKREPDEVLLDGISIKADRSLNITDNNGYFIFDDVRTGFHEVGFNLSELSKEYSVVTERKIVQVRENENVFIEFGLTKLGEIKGRVYLENKNTEDVTLSRIGIIIEELDRTVFTKSDGTFLMSNIPLGTYTLKIMEKSLPKGTMITNDGNYKIDITSETLIQENFNIPLVYKK